MRLTIAFTALLTAILAGCATPGSGGSLTLKQIRLDVGWKMEAYQEAVTYRYVTEAQKQQVSSAYQAYQAAFHQALAAAQGNLNTSAPANVTQFANQLISAVDGVLSTLANRRNPLTRSLPA